MKRMKTGLRNGFLAALFFGGLITVAFYPLFSNNVVAVQGDGVGYLAGKIFMMDSLQAGEFPFWNPFVGMGTPFMADVQQTVFSPFVILYFLFDTPLAFNLVWVIQVFLACFFMYLLMKEYVESDVVAITVGAIFGFSTMMSGGRIEHNTFSSTIAMFPAILYCIEKYKKTLSEKWLAYSALAMAVQFLSGFTQICLYFDFLVFAYLIWVFRYEKSSLKSRIIKLLKWGGAYASLIAIQLIPLLQLINQSGRDKVPWEFFSSYAYDIRILLMMLYPYAYINQYMAFDVYHSSDMDIEIYLGVICIIYIMYEIRYHYKEKQTKLLTIFAVSSFLFGMVPHIPMLGKIVYHLPFIGSFRCCARVLPLFLFCLLLLLGLGLHRLKDPDERKKIEKVNFYFSGMLLLNLIIIAFVFSQSQFFSVGGGRTYQKNFLVCMVLALMMSLVNLALLKLADFWKENKYIWKIAVILVGIITVCDVSRFGVQMVRSRVVDTEEALSDGLPETIAQYIDSDTENQFRSFMVVNDVSDSTSEFVRLGQFSRAMSEERLIYNSYITFLDAKLGYWGIKETLLYPRFTAMLGQKTDLASMMGIRHILDADEIQVSTTFTDGTIESMVSNKAMIQIPAASGITAYSEPAEWIQSDSFYEIELECEDGVAIPDPFYVDFFGDNYDLTEQDGTLQATDRPNTFKARITTQSIPNDVELYFRIVGAFNSDLLIKSITINKLKPQNLLDCEMKEEGIAVFKNSDARPLLYVPERIYTIDSYGDSWMDAGLENVDKNNYIVGFGEDINLTNTKTEISNVNMQRNSISAVVKTEEESFVNFSQLSYPGWRAYVDDGRVACYNVNNLIMGMRVPTGEHVIEFRFLPTAFIIGLSITGIGVICVLIWVFAPKIRRNKK